MARRKKDEKTKDLFAFADDNNKPSIVYIAVNIVNGKRYVGITRMTLKRRAQGHLASALRPHTHDNYFGRAIRKYGKDMFDFFTVATFPTYEAAAKKERELISEIKPEYNVSPGGEMVSGYRASAATREKQSQIRLHKPNRYWLGKKRPDIAAMQRRRIAEGTMPRNWNGAIGRKGWTEQSLASWRKAMAERGQSEAKRIADFGRRKPIKCVTDGRLFIGGMPEACEFYGFRYQSLMKVLRGKRNKLYGLEFVYASKDDAL